MRRSNLCAVFPVHLITVVFARVVTGSYNDTGDASQSAHGEGKLRGRTQGLNYYKRHDELPFEERCKLNYDHPDAFDNALLIYHLQELKAGRAIDCPVYDYSNHNRSDKVQHIEPAPVLIVEGILPFVEPELCALFDYKIYVDTDADERILRRLVRDVKERGRSLDSVIDQYLTTVKPMHEAFVEPSKRNADIIVPNGGENTAAVEMLAHHIRNLIEKANMM